MDNKSVEVYCISKNDIDDCNFFRALINICYKNNLLKEDKLEAIGYERMKMLQTVMTYYTKNESSSIPVEAAESILENLDFIIGVYLREIDSVNEILGKLNHESIEYMFDEGRKIIKNKFLKNEKLLEDIQKNKIICENMTYNDTIDYGLSIFFKSYNDLFEAHVAPCSVDYQLLCDVNNYSGILYIEKYLYYLKLENKFCSYFSNENIVNLLSGYDEKYELLLINIFELVMTNALGLILCEKMPYGLNITEDDRMIIERKLKKLSFEEIKQELLKCSISLEKVLKIKDEELIKYINASLEKISVSIYENIKIDKLDKVFISFKEYEKKINYIDNERMPDKMFRIVTEKIRSINSMDDKIKYINDNIKSITDLRDMLCSECLYADEYYEYFKNLSVMQKSLLYKYIEEYNEKKEWTEYFLNYLSKLSLQEKNQIKNIAEKIQY